MSRQIKTIEDAIALAFEAHLGQKDKGGAPYILHPLRVMFRVGACADEVAIAAVLHDVFEDSDLNLSDFEFPKGVRYMLINLTRRTEESYDDYIKRLLTCRHCARIKEADLLENLDASRLWLGKVSKDRIERYLGALATVQHRLWGKYEQ